MWNELRAEYPFTLYCAYPLSALDGDAVLGDANVFADAHSSVVSLPTTAVDPVRRSSDDDDEKFVRAFVPTLSAPRAPAGSWPPRSRARRRGAGDRRRADHLRAGDECNRRTADRPSLVTISRLVRRSRSRSGTMSATGPRLQPLDASRVGGRRHRARRRRRGRLGERGTESDGKAVWATLARERRPVRGSPPAEEPFGRRASGGPRTMGPPARYAWSGFCRLRVGRGEAAASLLRHTVGMLRASVIETTCGLGVR